jgi:hypothetical protein
MSLGQRASEFNIGACFQSALALCTLIYKIYHQICESNMQYTTLLHKHPNPQILLFFFIKTPNIVIGRSIAVV